MLTVQGFGRALVQSGDLDPIYLMLNGAGLDPATVQRWCLGYWMFYHAGVASRLSEEPGKRFWQKVQQAQDEKWPRGTERRHFKGAASQAAINNLRTIHPSGPEEAVLWVVSGSSRGFTKKNPHTTQDFLAVRERVMQWRGFGPWIAFKVADMTDAVLGVPVDFTSAIPHLFDDPVKGAVYVWRLEGDDVGVTQEELKDFHDSLEPAKRREMVPWAISKLDRELGTLNCPHAPARTLRVQEYETILCKYKSHLHGKYPVGKDTTEILHGLKGWGPVADKCYRALLEASTDRLVAR